MHGRKKKKNIVKKRGGIAFRPVYKLSLYFIFLVARKDET